MEISDSLAPLLVQALRDAVRYNEQLLQSETLRDRSEYEEYLVHVSQLFSEVKSEYRKIEKRLGVKLEDLL
jgi:hypothetical protein